jgi:hypothetical protein
MLDGDWSSDVCSSDLSGRVVLRVTAIQTDLTIAAFTLKPIASHSANMQSRRPDSVLHLKSIAMRYRSRLLQPWLSTSINRCCSGFAIAKEKSPARFRYRGFCILR